MSDADGVLYLLAGHVLHASYDGAQSWEMLPFPAPIVGVVPTPAGLLACDPRNLKVSHDHGGYFESHELPLYFDSRRRETVQGFCCTAAAGRAGPRESGDRHIEIVGNSIIDYD